MKNFYAIVLLLSFCVSLKGQDRDCRTNQNAFQFNELISYEVGYYLSPLWISAGEVNFSIKDTIIDDVPLFHFDSDGKTFKAYDLFFKVRDRYQSFVKVENFEPVHFIRDVSEGGTKVYRDVVFNFENLNAISNDSIVTPITSCTFDVLSAIYSCRNITFIQYEENDTIPLTLYLDNAVHEVYIRYLGKEEVDTDLGEYNCIKFKPLLIEGTLFEAGEEMTVWVTDDENKIPLMVESPILIGSVRAEIKSIVGAKYSFSSKIE